MLFQSVMLLVLCTSSAVLGAVFPYASSYNAHTVNHAIATPVAAPLVAAPAAIADPFGRLVAPAAVADPFARLAAPFAAAPLAAAPLAAAPLSAYPFVF